MKSQERCWRVFYTFPRAEKKCEERLAQGDIEVFLPKRAVLRQWKDRKKKVIEPLFRNYLFARVDERERLRVLRTQGIVQSVAFGGRLAEVSEEEIEQIRLAQQGGSHLSVVDYVPRPDRGTRVTIVEGPLRGLRGEVADHRGQTHLLVAIPAIRQALKVNVPAAWIRAADTHRPAA